VLEGELITFVSMVLRVVLVRLSFAFSASTIRKNSELDVHKMSSFSWLLMTTVVYLRAVSYADQISRLTHNFYLFIHLFKSGNCLAV